MKKQENNIITNSQKLDILFLGTGTSTGVPEIGCTCQVCRSTNTKDKRLRSSVLLRSANKTVLIDSGPDFRQQMLTHQINHLDAILITHEHYDHVAGLDDVRPLGSIDLYAEGRVLQAIKNNMPYSFSENKFPLSVPEITLHPIDDKHEFSAADMVFCPIRLNHFKLTILGFRTSNFAYLTDFNDIPEAEFEKLQNLDVLVIDALRIKPHPSHNALEQALFFIEKIKPHRAYLTHISHGMGLHEEVQLVLPNNVFLAYDGLDITTN